MKISKQIIIDVIPLTRIPLAKNQSFSYLSDVRIATGSLVSIPFFHRTVQGITTGNRPDFLRLGNIKLKKISLVIEENFITPKQLGLADFISEYYFSPLGIVLKSFVPKRVKARIKKFSPETLQKLSEADLPNKSEEIILTQEQKNAIQKITNSKLKNKGFLLFGPAGSGKTEVYINAIKKIKNGGQALVLLPELTLTPQAVERYGAHFGKENISVLNSKVSKGEYYRQWQRIRSGESKIIIGSRMAVFAPFKKLSLIVIDEEQDISFKQWDMNPRYDARKVAEKLSELHNCKIILGSATPSVESYYKASEKECELLKLPYLNLSGNHQKNNLPAIEIIDMKKEHWIRNYSPTSKKLQSELNYILKNRLQAILFINRQGMSSFSICANCKTPLKCPECERALILDNSGVYKCLHCAYKTSATPACSKCKNINFTNIGQGTQKIEREISNLFPSARIGRADNSTMALSKAQEDLYEQFSSGKIDILIGTQMITKGWDLPNVALIGIIDGDELIAMPDFLAYERAFQHIVQVSGRTNRPKAKYRGTVLIQTFNPDNFIFKLAAERNYAEFYKKEIAERKELGLPPFGKITKILFHDYDHAKVAAETGRIYDLISKIPQKSVKISEPQDPLINKVRGRYQKQIIIKNSAEALPAEIRRTLASLPSGWIIDADPISII